VEPTRRAATIHERRTDRAVPDRHASSGGRGKPRPEPIRGTIEEEGRPRVSAEGSRAAPCGLPGDFPVRPAVPDAATGTAREGGRSRGALGPRGRSAPRPFPRRPGHNPPAPGKGGLRLTRSVSTVGTRWKQGGTRPTAPGQRLRIPQATGLVS